MGYSDDEDAAMVRHMRMEDGVARAMSGNIQIADITNDEAAWFRSALEANARDYTPRSWRPWWQHPEVEEDPQSPSASSSSTRCMATRVNPPIHVCCANGRLPHASVAFTALSILYAYVHTMRASNGGWEWAPLEAAPNLLHICPAICSHQIFKSANESLCASVDAAATLADGGFGVDFDLLCVEDLQTLISAGAHCCAVAIQDIVNIFDACLAAGSHASSGKIRRGIKKLHFLTSFAFHHFELLQPLAAVANEYA